MSITHYTTSVKIRLHYKIIAYSDGDRQQFSVVFMVEFLTTQHIISTVEKLPFTIQKKKTEKNKTDILSLSQKKEKV